MKQEHNSNIAQSHWNSKANSLFAEVNLHKDSKYRDGCYKEPKENMHVIELISFEFRTWHTVLPATIPSTTY